MLRLKTILIASIVAVPFIVNAADWSMNMETKNAITVDLTKKDSADVESDWEDEYSYKTGNGNNFSFGKIQFNIKGDNFTVKAQLKGYTGKAKAGDFFVDYTVSDGLKLRLGYAGSPFTVKNVDNYKGQSTIAGKYGISSPELNLSLYINGVVICLGANENKIGVLDDSTGAAIGDPKVYIPKVSLGYDFSNDMIRFGAYTALNVTQQEYLEAGKTDSTDLASMSFVGFGGATHLRLHLSQFWIQISALFALNSDLVGIGNNYGLQAQVINGTTKSYTIFGAPVSVQYDISDNLSWNAGFGMFVESESIDDAPEYSGWEMCTGFQIKNLLPGLKIWPDFLYSQKSKKVGDVTTTDKKMSIGVGTQLWF